uniref:Uncharacterized protein n=1 Tax=Brassica oleracea TaxID=3712 RepID=A0A3P6FRI5_BRAOL|nr:unnamed protein product [Brassica oleracea]
MLDEICGLIGVLRRGHLDWSLFDQARIRAAFARPEGTNMAPLVGGSEDEAKHSQEVIATHSVRAQSSDRLTRQLVRRSLFCTSRSVSKNRASGKSTLPAGCHLPSLASSAEKEAYAKVAVASSKVMEAFNEYVVMMEDHLEAAKREGKKDAEKIEALTEDWRIIHHENEALTTLVVAQKAKAASLKAERDRDIRRASRIARSSNL